jgi:hypothetical protein
MRGRFKHTGMIIFFLGVLGLAPTGVTAEQPEAIIVRASIVPAEGIWVGQRVRYQVDVLGLNGWAKIQRMPDIQVSGAILVALESQGVRLNETLEGQAYTGQRYELSLFPQRSGRIAIPPVSLDIEISQWGSQSQKGVQKKATPPVDFMAELPPGSETVPGLISTTQLTAEQRWDPDIKKVAVGEAVERTLQLSAEDISAMAFTPMSFAGNDSVDVYPRAPEVEDRYNRGTLSGRRTERVTYLFKKSGSVELPAITLTWWDLQNKKLREAVLPSRVIEIFPSDAVHNDPMAQESTFNKSQRVYVGILFVGLIALIGFYRKQLRLRWNTWRREKKASEKACFRRFVKAARSGKPTDALNALMHWLDRIDTRDQAARLDLFLGAYSDPKVAKEADRLYQAMNLYAQTDWHGRELIKGITAARRKWLVQQRKSITAHRRLPRLNP